MIPLGRPITLFGKWVGLALKQSGSSYYLCSFHDGLTNRKELVHTDHIEVGGNIYKVHDTSNEVVEQEDAGCEGGACKI